LVLSNLGKVMYPADGFTKGDVIDYYLQIAPTMLTHPGRRWWSAAGWRCNCATCSGAYAW
jgi:DNA primase